MIFPQMTSFIENSRWCLDLLKACIRHWIIRACLLSLVFPALLNTNVQEWTCAGLLLLIRGSPAKNVWLVDGRPRDIAKFKMATIPPSFLFSSGKKINCGLIWVANADTDIFRIPRLFLILFHQFLWDSLPAMLAFWPVYRIQLWTLHDHERQQYFLWKPGY